MIIKFLHLTLPRHVTFLCYRLLFLLWFTLGVDNKTIGWDEKINWKNVGSQGINSDLLVKTTTSKFENGWL